jgi:PPM family protein phosphatase
MRTSRGPGKRENEDTAAAAGTILVGEHGAGLTVGTPPGVTSVILITDGMGGHVAGRTASRFAAERLSGDERVLAAAEASVAAAVIETHEALYDTMRDEPALSGMGTTVVGLCIPPVGNALGFNVGDSRLLMRDPDIGVVQLSVDDAERVGSGTGAELTQCLGGTSQLVRIVPHTIELELRNGDRFMLCSDGLTDVIAEQDAARELAADRPVADIASRLVEAARRAGAEDDVTVVVVDIAEAS